MNLDSNDRKILFSIVRIETDNKNIWTWFLVRKEFNNIWMNFLVTNKHVLEWSQHTKIFFYKNQKKTWKPLLISFYESTINTQNWFQTTDIDLAIVNVSDIFNNSNWLIYSQMISLNDEHIYDSSKHEIGINDQLFFLWYPEWIFDNSNNMPIIRSWTIATLPELEYQWKSEFLINWHIYPWNSWGLVFVHHKFWNWIKHELVWNNLQTKLLDKTIFLWILTYVYQRNKSTKEIVKKNITKLSDDEWYDELWLWWVIKFSEIKKYIEEYYNCTLFIQKILSHAQLTNQTKNQ